RAIPRLIVSTSGSSGIVVPLFSGRLRLNHAAGDPPWQLSGEFSDPPACPSHPLTVPAGGPRIEFPAD
ncbi:MAG: hypothetical protein CMJ73_01765, partial [Planctomycetaceae bacterium]|nr:hypothetical protein [Planctomycetaceae bacterium]